MSNNLDKGADESILFVPIRSDTEIIQDLLETQGMNGNWDYNEYMLGLYNGLELSLSILQKREPNYKTPPAKWRVSVYKRVIKFIKSLRVYK